MKKIIKIKHLLVPVIVILICFTGHAQFKADMYNIMGGEEKIFKIFSDNGSYRYEFDEDGQQGVVISKNGASELIILMPQQKMAMKIPLGSPMSMANDPVKAYEYYRETENVKEIGKETVNGIECTKSEVWNKDENANQKLFTVWYSEKYKFPVKITNSISGSMQNEMILKNIESWTSGPDSFEVPEGYQIMDQSQMAPQY